MHWLSRLIDALLPRHRDAERARQVRVEELVRLLRPETLKGMPWIHTLLPYHDERVRAEIKAIKFYGERDEVQKLVRGVAGAVTDIIVEETLSGHENHVFVPVPASSARMRERGYAQAVLIAQTLANEVGVECQELLMKHDRPTQARIARSLRAKNVSGAFYVLPERSSSVLGSCIILIDDVAESGATLNDCRRALLDAGARSVIAIAIAH